MPVFKNIKKIFVHIPRTGGTSILEYFKSIKEPLDSRFADFKHYTYEDYSIIDNFFDYEIFTVVRNPYTRIISYFNYHLANDNNVVKYLNSANCITIKEKFNLYLKINLTETPYKFDREKPLLLHKTQSSYINLKNVKVLKFETLNSDFNIYMGKKSKRPHLTSIPLEFKRFEMEDLFSDESSNLINEYYIEDFKNFNYEIL